MILGREGLLWVLRLSQRKHGLEVWGGRQDPRRRKASTGGIAQHSAARPPAPLAARARLEANGQKVVKGNTRSALARRLRALARQPFPSLPAPNGYSSVGGQGVWETSKWSMFLLHTDVSLSPSASLSKMSKHILNEG